MYSLRKKGLQYSTKEFFQKLIDGQRKHCEETAGPRIGSEVCVIPLLTGDGHTPPVFRSPKNILVKSGSFQKLNTLVVNLLRNKASFVYIFTQN